MQTTTVTVTDSATPLYNPEPRSTGHGDTQVVSLVNNAGVDVYIGGDNVTTTLHAFVLTSSGSASMEVENGAGRVYAVVATGTADVDVTPGVRKF